MNQYNNLNVTLSSSQFNRIKPGIKTNSEGTSSFHQMWLVILMMALIFYRNHLWTDWQISRICQNFKNNSTANIKLTKTELSKIVQSQGFIGRALGPLLKTDLP